MPTHKHYLTHEDLLLRAYAVAAKIIREVPLRKGREVSLYPVPRGGVPAAYLVANAIIKHHPEHRVKFVTFTSMADVIIDDIIDSGTTRASFADTSLPFLALVDKTVEYNIGWVVFPWENSGEEDLSANDIPLRLLEFIGEDVKRGGLQETPARFLKAWEFWTSGYNKDPNDILKVFEDGGEGVDQMVLVRDIPVYSHCEHHLAPIFGVAHVAYIPAGNIVGLSKLNRLVDIFARRLQVQERLTNQIADALVDGLAPQGVGVMMRCRHLCMESRGVCQQGHVTITSALRGAIRQEADARAEFMKLCE